MIALGNYREAIYIVTVFFAVFTGMKSTQYVNVSFISFHLWDYI